MTAHVAEVYKQITGTAPPKPWSERTHEERLLARKLFLETVRDSPDDDAAIEEFVLTIRAEVPSHSPDIS